MTGRDKPIATEIKRLLSEPSRRIELDELITHELEKLIINIDPTKFPLNEYPVNAESVQRRLAAYREAIADTTTAAALVGRWGDDSNMLSLGRILTRVSDQNEVVTGTYAWLALAWFPFMALSYFAGIAALSAERYAVLAAMYSARRGLRSRSYEHRLVFVRAISSISATATDDAFKLLQAPYMTGHP